MIQLSIISKLMTKGHQNIALTLIWEITLTLQKMQSRRVKKAIFMEPVQIKNLDPQKLAKRSKHNQ